MPRPLLGDDRTRIVYKKKSTTPSSESKAPNPNRGLALRAILPPLSNRRFPPKGDLKGFWSLTVTGNWRLIFRYDEQTNTAGDIDLIDYHEEAEMPMKNPPHPGDLIKTEVIEPLGLSVSKAAEILKVRRATLSDLLHGKATLTKEMVLRIELAFGQDMDHLLRIQLAYDVTKTRAHARASPSRDTPLPEAMPWIAVAAATAIRLELIRLLLGFIP